MSICNIQAYDELFGLVSSISPILSPMLCFAILLITIYLVLDHEVCQQIARFFYACAIPFNNVKFSKFVKILELVGKYVCQFKHLWWGLKETSEERKEDPRELEYYKMNRKGWVVHLCQIVGQKIKEDSFATSWWTILRELIFLSFTDISNF